MLISPLQKYGPSSQRYGGRFFLPLTARDFSLRVTYPFCGAGLQADTVDSRTCPPEGGRYMTRGHRRPRFYQPHNYSTYVFPAGCKYSPHVFLGGVHTSLKGSL